MNRRQFMQRGLLGGVLLGAAGYFAATRPTHEGVPPSEPLQSLSTRAYHVLTAVMACILPNGAEVSPVAIRFDRAVAQKDPAVQADLEKLLLLLDNALSTFVLDHRLGTFTSLSRESQNAVLDSWRESRIAVRRTGYQALRRLTLAFYYADPAVQGALGYTLKTRVAGVSYEDPMWGVES
jgi:Gluconate 2-dehydrogenase subunit 3